MLLIIAGLTEPTNVIDKVHVNKTSDNSDKLDVTHPNFDIPPLATCYGKKKTTKKNNQKKTTKKKTSKKVTKKKS